MFARGLGCENPTETIKTERARLRSVRYLGAIVVVVGLSVLSLASPSTTLLQPWHAGVFVFILAVMIITPLSRIDRARKLALVLIPQQEPFWLTGASIGLSSHGTLELACLRYGRILPDKLTGFSIQIEKQVQFIRVKAEVPVELRIVRGFKS